jgi:hypothetical protein
LTRGVEQRARETDAARAVERLERGEVCRALFDATREGARRVAPTKCEERPDAILVAARRRCRGFERRVRERRTGRDARGTQEESPMNCLRLRLTARG